MAKGFTLTMYPWVFKAKFRGEGRWTEEWEAKPHLSPDQEDALSESDREALLARRNSFPDLPLVNFTTQYGMGCFEGLKAFPQKDGSLKLFRPDENAKRMKMSMEGLMMPGVPLDVFLRGVTATVRRNAREGFRPVYDPAWEKDDFVSGHSVYVRPFSFAEPGIGLGISKYPWVVVVTTPVGSYFSSSTASSVTTDKARATPGGTGWIKCDSNYVIPTLVKKQAEAQGYMEAVFLDSVEHQYVEEGSSCNIFFVLQNGTLATPQLGDTILPGINRKSVIEIAKSVGIKVEERLIAIDEVLSDAKEVFVTGTAAGVQHIDSITHGGKTVVFCKREIGETTRQLRKMLKGIQYGAIPDKFGWLVEV